MDVEEAFRKLGVLKASLRQFDYNQTGRYVSLVKEFLRRSARYCEVSQRPTTTPFIEIGGLHDLPAVIKDNLLDLAKERKWSPVCLRSCQWHLRYLANADSLNPTQAGICNVYEPLFSLIAEGGDFYEHHGDICIRDAATVTLKRQ